MAKAKAVGRDGIDTWTNNGYGLTVEKNDSKKKKEEIEKLNEEIRRYIQSEKR